MSDDEAIRLLVDYATNDEYAYGYRYRTRSSSARDRAPAVLAALRAQWEAESTPRIPDAQSRRIPRYMTDAEFHAAVKIAEPWLRAQWEKELGALLPRVYDGTHLVDCPYVDALMRVRAALNLENKE